LEPPSSHEQDVLELEDRVRDARLVKDPIAGRNRDVTRSHDERLVRHQVHVLWVRHEWRQRETARVHKDRSPSAAVHGEGLVAVLQRLADVVDERYLHLFEAGDDGSREEERGYERTYDIFE
jgi:hypothetical protein